MTNRKIHLYNVVQVLIGLCIYLLCCFASFLFGGADVDSLLPIAFLVAKAVLFPISVYLLNFCVFIPRFLFSGREVQFFLVNICMIAAAMFFPALNLASPELGGMDMDQGGMSSGKFVMATVIVSLILYICMIALAVGMRYVVRWNNEKEKLEEEHRRNTEAELDWLKSQLNPHFLFNTLNNISSMIQIDAEKAQDSIGQLSELLRYALYESNMRKVKIVDEIGFMSNYIDLMSLRCNEKTRIKVRFDRFDPALMISPLIFVSLIENAFKHGASAHKESFIEIDMGMDGEDLVFSCANTIMERPVVDRVGSGIGVENMKRRLELLYPENYSYRQYVENGAYVVIVRIANAVCHV
ncbi:MAG: sensor histidine kinase [Bacteroidales bacterium]|nr:sensor histidine kinase [Bacteroidales bacterium]